MPQICKVVYMVAYHTNQEALVPIYTMTVRIIMPRKIFDQFPSSSSSCP